MKPQIIYSLILAVVFSLFLFACNQPAKTDAVEKTTRDTTETKSPSASMPEYDPAMDPLKVEAAFVKLLADTLNVKFYEGTFKPGDSVALHTHPDHLVYVVEGGTLSIYNKEGVLNVLELKEGMGLMLGTETHSGKNTGKTTVKLLIADIYRPRG